MKNYLVCNEYVFSNAKLKPSVNLSMSALAYNDLIRFINPNEVKSIAEYNGDQGILSLINIKYFRPIRYFVNDTDSDNVSQLQSLLKRNLVPRSTVSQKPVEEIVGTIVESSELFVKGYDLVVLKFDSYTMKSYLKNPKPLNMVFSHNPKYVIITDTAVPKFYLNKAVYENLLKVKLTGVKHYFQHYQFKGYGIKAVSAYSNASFILFERNYHGEFKFHKLSSSPQLVKKGLRELRG